MKPGVDPRGSSSSLNIIVPTKKHEDSSPSTFEKRKDYLDIDAAAKNHPNRTYYYRTEIDKSLKIIQCNERLKLEPNNIQARHERGLAFFKLQVR